MQLSFRRWFVTWLGWVVATFMLTMTLQEYMLRKAYQSQADEAQAIGSSCIEMVAKTNQALHQCNNIVDQCIGHLQTEKVFQFEYKGLIAKSELE